MSDASELTIPNVLRKLEEISRFLEAQAEGEGEELWRFQAAHTIIEKVRSDLASGSAIGTEAYWHVAGNIRSIFRGWTDSSPEFEVPAALHRLLFELYEQTLRVSGHK